MAKETQDTKIRFDNRILQKACAPYLETIFEQLTASPVANMVCDAAFRCDRDQQAGVLGNVVLAGGGSCIGPTDQSVPDSLREQIETIIHSHTPGWRVKMLAPGKQERAIASWLGGSILGSLGTFHEMWISKAEYDEWGCSIVNRTKAELAEIDQALEEGTTPPHGTDLDDIVRQEEEMLENIPLPGTPTEEAERRKEWLKIPIRVRTAIRRLHIEFGHCPKSVLVPLLRAGGMSKEHIRAAQLYKCAACQNTAQQPQSKKVSLPKPYELNEIAGIDVFELRDASGMYYDILNAVDMGYNVRSSMDSPSR